MCVPLTIALSPALLASSTVQPCRNAILLLSVFPWALLLPLDFNPVVLQFFYSQLKEEHTPDIHPLSSFSASTSCEESWCVMNKTPICKCLFLCSSAPAWCPFDQEATLTQLDLTPTCGAAPCKKNMVIYFVPCLPMWVYTSCFSPKVKIAPSTMVCVGLGPYPFMLNTPPRARLVLCDSKTPRRPRGRGLASPLRNVPTHDF